MRWSNLVMRLIYRSPAFALPRNANAEDGTDTAMGEARTAEREP